jgi:hypothetical protein
VDRRAIELVMYFDQRADEADRVAARLWAYQKGERAGYFEGMRDAYRVAASKVKAQFREEVQVVQVVRRDDTGGQSIGPA